MPNYALGKIYVVRNTVNENLYVGSTTQTLSARMSGHRRAIESGTMALYNAMKELGVENFYIELIEACPCTSREELCRAEGVKIRELKTIETGYNKNIAGRTTPERSRANYEANTEAFREKSRAYYKDHKEQRIEYSRAYREANKEKVIACNKACKDARKNTVAYKAANLRRSQAYYDENKDKIKDYKTSYYLKHRAKIAAESAVHRANHKDEVNAAQRARYATRQAKKAAAAANILI